MKTEASTGRVERFIIWMALRIYANKIESAARWRHRAVLCCQRKDFDDERRCVAIAEAIEEDAEEALDNPWEAIREYGYALICFIGFVALGFCGK